MGSIIYLRGGMTVWWLWLIVNLLGNLCRFDSNCCQYDYAVLSSQTQYNFVGGVAYKYYSNDICIFSKFIIISWVYYYSKGVVYGLFTKNAISGWWEQ